MLSKLVYIFTKNQTLVFILILSAFLRLLHPTFGSPVLYVTGDEAPNYMNALYMIAHKSLAIDTAIYPPFGAIIQTPFLLLAFALVLLFGVADSVSELKLLVLSQQGYFLFVPRLLSAVMGVATVYLVYKIVRLLDIRTTYGALLSAFLFAVSFNHVQMSHFGRPWAAAMFFFALSVYFALRSISVKSDENKSVLLAGVFTVITFGFHQVGVQALWFLVLCRLFGKSGAKRQKIINNVNLRSFIISVLGMGGLVYINSFGPTTGWFRNRVDFPTHYTTGEVIWAAIVDNQLLYQFRQLAILEPVIFLAFILFLISDIFKSRVNLVLGLFVVSTYLITSFSFAQPRYLLPVIMMMSVTAGRALIGWHKGLQNNFGRVTSIVLLIILILASVNAIWWNYIFIRPPTFMIAHKWIESHVPVNKVLLTTSLKYTGFAPSKKMIALQQKRHLGFYQELYIRLEEEEYPANVRNIIYLDKLENINHLERVPVLLNNFPIKYHFIMDLYWDPKESRMHYVDKSKFIKRASFSPLKDKDQRVRIDNILASTSQPLLVSLLNLERTGPYVDIYEAK